MHLSIVHKERIEIKEEQIICKSEPNLGFEKELLMCDICDLNFETQIILKQHVASRHEVEKPFRCEICNHSFSQKRSLKRHIESVHEARKQFNCDL